MLIRRSHTRGSEVMEATKTDRDQIIALDERQLDALRWHCDRLDRENEKRAKRSQEIANAMKQSPTARGARSAWKHRRGSVHDGAGWCSQVVMKWSCR